MILRQYFDAMPFDILWDLEKYIIYFITQKGVIEYDDKTKQQKLISEPLEKIERFDRGWIDKQGVVNISYAVKLGVVTGSVEEDRKIFLETTKGMRLINPCYDTDELLCRISKIGSNNNFIITETTGSLFGKWNYGITGPSDCNEDGFNVIWYDHTDLARPKEKS